MDHAHRRHADRRTPAPEPASGGGGRRFQCRHIFTDGHRCGSPCLRREDFCFYHHTTRGRQAIATRDLSQGEHQATPFNLPIASLEDRSAIQSAIGEVLNRLATNQLDPRRAGLLLYGLQIASLNLPRPSAIQPPNAPGELVEEIIADPDLGPLAPRAEVPLASDTDYTRPSLARILLNELRHSAKPQPTTLPDVQSAASPSSPLGRHPAADCHSAAKRRNLLHQPTPLPAQPSPQAEHPHHQHPAALPTPLGCPSAAKPEHPLHQPTPPTEPSPQAGHPLPEPTSTTRLHRRPNRLWPRSFSPTLAILEKACRNPSFSPSSTAGATAPKPTATP